MSATITDRIAGISSSVALKAPVRAATTANITLSGAQTIDAVAVVAGDRVLVKNQTDQTENGIYDVKDGAWSRAKDMNANRDVVKGTMVFILEGTANGQNFYRVSAANPITIGTTNLTWVLTPGAGTQGPQGDAGAKGDKGDKGDQGTQGVQGLQGIQGLQGNVGPQGDKGDKGDPGAQGNQGIQGLQGQKGDKGDKGDPGPDWASQWVTDTSYVVDKVVYDAGSSYICTQAHTANAGNRPGSGGSWPSYWDLVALRGDTGAQGPQGNQGPAGNDGATGLVWRGNWTSPETFNSRDAVYHNGASFYALMGHSTAPDNEPGVGSNWEDYWDYLSRSGSLEALTPVSGGVVIGNGTSFDIKSGATLRASMGLAIGTDVQAYDTELAALAGLTSTADKLPYFTGAGTAGLADFTGFGRTLVANANASDARIDLGLVIGTNVQAYDAELAAIAGLTSAADRLPYYTGAGTAALAIFTTAARNLLDDATATDMRTTLGVGTADNPEFAALNVGHASDTTITRVSAGLIAVEGSNVLMASNIGSSVQAYDTELAALAGLTSAANKIPMFSGSGTASLLDFRDEDNMVSDSATSVPSQQSVKAYVDASVAAGIGDADYGDIVVSGGGTTWLFDSSVVTTFARTFLDDIDAATVRTTLGLAIGTNVQAYDAELASIAGLTSAADRLPYFTGSGTAALATFTAGGRALVNSAGTANTFPYFSASNTVTLGSITTAGRAILDDADATAQRATLGLVIGTNVQAYDAELAALAGLTSAADTGIYFTGSGTAGTYTLTSFARGLLDDADAATMRTTLGLVIGTNVQAYDGELAALAGLTSAADKLPYFTGAGTAGLADFTTFGRSLVDDADASTARTTLGLVIGTDVQAYHSTLAALAGLTGAADKRPYFTGAGTMALRDELTALSVGSFVFAVRSGTSSYSPGSTIAGSSLQPGTAAGVGSGSSLSGTWQCCGYITTSGTGGNSVTLWQRIS